MDARKVFATVAIAAVAIAIVAYALRRREKDVRRNTATLQDYGEWGEESERIVYKDAQFIIVKYPANTRTGFCYQVVPVQKGTVKRLGDWEICPEPDTFEKAVKMMEDNRPYWEENAKDYLESEEFAAPKKKDNIDKRLIYLAKNMFPTVGNVANASYILPDGTMIATGEFDEDDTEHYHNAIALCWEDDLGYINEMNKKVHRGRQIDETIYFMTKTASIRVKYPEGIEMVYPPTKEQIKRLNLSNWRNPFHDAFFAIDYTYLFDRRDVYSDKIKATNKALKKSIEYAIKEEGWGMYRDKQMFAAPAETETLINLFSQHGFDPDDIDMEQAEDMNFEGDESDWQASLERINDVIYTKQIPPDWLKVVPDKTVIKTEESDPETRKARRKLKQAGG